MSDEVIRRKFQAELTPVGDGRTLDVRIVPYNTREEVRDGDGPKYVEEWAPGVFRNKQTTLENVLLNVEHEQGFAAKVGRAVSYTDTPEGFEGEFRMLSDQASDKALELVNAGIYTGVSVEAIPLETKRTDDGVVRRISAKLVGVALTSRPAYKAAGVLAVREEPDTESDPEPPPPDPSRTDQTLSRIGYEPLALAGVTDRAWSDARKRFTDEEYERSCLVAGRLPVLEPDGTLNVVAMRQAASKLHASGLPMEQKAQAARKLRRYYTFAGETPSRSLLALAER